MEGKTKQTAKWLSKSEKPIIIAGPCSAETETQVISAAEEIALNNQVNIFRAGIWKPRTRPDSFEGVGIAGLPWLQRVRNETRLAVTTEVAKAAHVEACLRHGVDILWLGARTTVNPFAVQEIADSLRGVDIPVMIKNPINPDLALWIGAMERLQKVGIKEIAVIHRGFSSLSEKYYRNKPAWQLPLEFKRLFPHIPMINDPSHICGRRDLLSKVAQKAMDLDFDGLMIESHCDPDQAWSDAAQQVTPQALQVLLDELVHRSVQEDSDRIQNDLDKLRKEINVIDDELINLISDRMRIARNIGLYKKDKNVTILQPKRWNEILQRCLDKADTADLSKAFVKELIDIIHDESISQQSQIFSENKK